MSCLRGIWNWRVNLRVMKKNMTKMNVAKGTRTGLRPGLSCIFVDKRSKKLSNIRSNGRVLDLSTIFTRKSKVIKTCTTTS